MAEICLTLRGEEFNVVEKDIEVNEEALKSNDAMAIELKCEFDSMLHKRLEQIANAKEIRQITPKSEAPKPKFKPRDLVVPKWNGELVTLNVWKQQITDYF